MDKTEIKNKLQHNAQAYAIDTESSFLECMLIQHIFDNLDISVFKDVYVMRGPTDILNDDKEIDDTIILMARKILMFTQKENESFSPESIGAYIANMLMKQFEGQKIALYRIGFTLFGDAESKYEKVYMRMDTY